MSAAATAVERLDITIPSGDAHCAAWLYRPSGDPRPPLVVLGHGLGATRELRLDAYCERVAASGMAALAFTYRHFGDSSGTPRQLLSIRRQLEDWEAVLRHAKARDDVDPARIAIWGSSFGGGHVITIGARHPELAAVVSQCPFTDGPASARALGVPMSLKALPVLARDLVAMATGRPPVTLPVAAAPGRVGLMNAHDAADGYEALIPEGAPFRKRSRGADHPGARRLPAGPRRPARPAPDPVLRQRHGHRRAGGADAAVRRDRAAGRDPPLRRRAFRLLRRARVRRHRRRPDRVPRAQSPMMVVR